MGDADAREPARAFIGSFTSAGGRGILTADVDPRTGALAVTGATATLPDPSFLAVDGPALYAVSEAEEGAVAAFDISGAAPVPRGAPTPVRGSGPTHLAVAAGHVLTANYGSGSVTALPVNADGTLAAAAHVARHQGSGPVADRQGSPHAHQVLRDPADRWVTVVDLGTDSVRIYALDPGTGTLRAHGETALRPGTGPRHLAFHPAGTHAYVLNELEPTLTVCRWNADAGVLEPLDEIPVVPAGTTAPSHPSAVVVSPDGRFLWVAVRGDDSLAVLALDPAGAKPAPAGTVSCGGRWPRDLALDPTGRWLYAANERSGDVTWFGIDPDTGLPHRAGSVDAPAASCVVFG